MVESNWRFELKEIIYSKLHGQSAKTLNAVYERDVRFDKYVASKMHQLSGDIFWGFQGSSHDSIIAARKSGKLTLCELSTAHAPMAKKILGEEQLLHPEWADSFDNLEFPPGYFERLCNEPIEADWVIGASSFTLRTLEESGIAKHKLKYLPLGFDVEKIPFAIRQSTTERKPLKILYAGRITQRKGIKYLLEAMRSFNRSDVELHIIGHLHGSGAGLQPYRDLYTLHQPVSQAQLFERYGDFDVLALPTIFEGFGLVVIEAMAAGLPVITTPNSIGPELIVNDENGYVVPIRNVPAIVNAIRTLLRKSPGELNVMRQSARNKALQFSWHAYTQRLKAMMELL